MSLWKRPEDMPLELRLLVGSNSDRAREAKRQGVTECWETKARRDWSTKPSDLEKSLSKVK
jgi:hypothetical protein